MQLWERVRWGCYNLYFESFKGLFFKTPFFSITFFRIFTLLTLNITELILLGPQTESIKSLLSPCNHTEGCVPILICVFFILNCLSLTPNTHFEQFYFKVASYFLPWSTISMCHWLGRRLLWKYIRKSKLVWRKLLCTISTIGPTFQNIVFWKWNFWGYFNPYGPGVWWPLMAQVTHFSTRSCLLAKALQVQGLLKWYIDYWLVQYSRGLPIDLVNRKSL